MRIVYCTDSICYPGGIQTVTIAKANALAEIDGNEVWIVVTDNKRKTVAKVSEKVHVVDLDVNYYEDDWKGYFYVLKGIFVKRKLHKKRLAEFLQRIQPDVVISTGTSEKYFLPTLTIESQPGFIREIHCYSTYRYLLAKTWFDRLMAFAGSLYDYKWKIRKYDRIVLLVDEDKNDNWKGNPKAVSIFNPITKTSKSVSNSTNKIAVSAGRLVHQKNFEEMIEVWKSVVDRHPDWILQIWGNGALETKLQQLIDENQLGRNVQLMGYSNNVIEEMSKASIFLLTSHVEGFSLVLLEAMSVGVAPVAYACKAGPSDIINSKDCGILVRQYDKETMTDAICILIEDEDKRREMGKAAKLRSADFAPEKIAAKWMTLFNELR